jgi:hypothetical protein
MNARCAVVTINVVYAMLWTMGLVWIIVALRVEHYLQAKALQATDSYWHNQYNQYNQYTNPYQQADAGNNRLLTQEDDGSWSSLSSWSQSWYDYWYGNTDDTLMSNMTAALSDNEVYESGGSSSSTSSCTWSSYWKQYFGDSVQYNTTSTLVDDDSSNTFTWLDSWNDYWVSLSTHGSAHTASKSDETTTTRHAQRSMPMWYTMAAFKILCSISGVVGAVYYNPYLIGAAAISWGASLLQSVLQWHVVALLASALCLYPHVILILRIQKQRQEQERGTSSCLLRKQ